MHCNVVSKIVLLVGFRYILVKKDKKVKSECWQLFEAWSTTWNPPWPKLGKAWPAAASQRFYWLVLVSFPIWLSDFQRYLDFRLYELSLFALSNLSEPHILRVSTAATMLPRCLEREGVTQPMCHTTQVRRQGGVVQIVTQRGRHPGWHTEARGGVTQVDVQRGCHRESQPGCHTYRQQGAPTECAGCD